MKLRLETTVDEDGIPREPRLSTEVVQLELDTLLGATLALAGRARRHPAGRAPGGRPHAEADRVRPFT